MSSGEFLTVPGIHPHPQLVFAGRNDPAAGGIATGAEILFGLLILVGWHTRVAALLSGLLLLTFGVAMTLALGIKAPLNFAVLTGVGGALLLANCEGFPFSVDELLFYRTIKRRTDESSTTSTIQSTESDHK